MVSAPSAISSTTAIRASVMSSVISAWTICATAMSSRMVYPCAAMSSRVINPSTCMSSRMAYSASSMSSRVAEFYREGVLGVVEDCICLD